MYYCTINNNSQKLNLIIMKKIKVILAVTIIAACLMSASSSAEVLSQSPDANRPYSLSQNQPNPFTETTRINFYLMDDCFVKLYTIDQQTGETYLLVEGDMSKGDHGVIFKALTKNGVNNYKCCMEIFLANGKVLAEKLSIEMKQVEGNKTNAVKK